MGGGGESLGKTCKRFLRFVREFKDFLGCLILFVDSRLLGFLYFVRFLPTFEIVKTFLSFCDFLQMYGIFLQI